MGKMTSSLYFNDELLITPYKQGVKLISPIDAPNLSTVQEILNLPFNTYFYDLKNQFIGMSESNAIAVGFSSVREGIHKSLSALPDKNALHWEQNNNISLALQRRLIKDEAISHADGLTKNVLTVKVPWYSESNELNGIFGCSIIHGIHELTSALDQIIKIGIFTNTSLNQKAHQQELENQLNSLTKKEMYVLKLVTQLHTSRDIAHLTHLSIRTVDHYVERIKEKLQAKNKYQLIQKMLLLQD